MAKAGVNLYFHSYSYSFNHESLSHSSFIPLPHSIPTFPSPLHSTDQAWMPMQVLSCTQYHATVSHQVFTSCFHPVVNAWIHALQGCLIIYFTVEICFIPTSQSCRSRNAGTTQVRAGRELKRSFPRLPRHTSCPTDVCVTSS